MTQRGKCSGAMTPLLPALAQAVMYNLYNSAWSIPRPGVGQTSSTARIQFNANCSFSCWIILAGWGTLDVWFVDTKAELVVTVIVTKQQIVIKMLYLKSKYNCVMYLEP